MFCFVLNSIFVLEAQLLCGSISVRQCLDNENLTILSNVRVHVEFQFGVSSSAALCCWFFFVYIEHEDSVLLTFNTLDNQTKHLAFEVSCNNRLILFNKLLDWGLLLFSLFFLIVFVFQNYLVHCDSSQRFYFNRSFVEETVFFDFVTPLREIGPEILSCLFFILFFFLISSLFLRSTCNTLRIQFFLQLIILFLCFYCNLLFLGLDYHDSLVQNVKSLRVVQMFKAT